MIIMIHLIQSIQTGMMMKKYKRKKGPVRSKKTTIEGITFASGIEKYMYMALKKAKIYSE